jgi:hypothetical protein
VRHIGEAGVEEREAGTEKKAPAGHLRVRAPLSVVCAVDHDVDRQLTVGEVVDRGDHGAAGSDRPKQLIRGAVRVHDDEVGAGALDDLEREPGRADPLGRLESGKRHPKRTEPLQIARDGEADRCPEAGEGGPKRRAALHVAEPSARAGHGEEKNARSRAHRR